MERLLTFSCPVQQGAAAAVGGAAAGLGAAGKPGARFGGHPCDGVPSGAGGCGAAARRRRHRPSRTRFASSALCICGRQLDQ